jgi:hypothetical protein
LRFNYTLNKKNGKGNGKKPVKETRNRMWSKKEKKELMGLEPLTSW